MYCDTTIEKQIDRVTLNCHDFVLFSTKIPTDKKCGLIGV